MQLFYIALAAALVIGSANGLWLPGRMVDRIPSKHFRQTMGGEPSEAIRPELRARARQRGLFLAVGGALGFTLGLALQFAPALATSDAPPSAIVILTTLASIYAADAAHSLVESSGHESPATRLARVPSPQLSDYVPPAATWIARAYGVMPAVAIVVVLLSDVIRPGASTGVVVSAVIAATLCLLTLIALEVLSSRLLARAQFASSEWELRWRDAQRAQTLRGLSTATATSAFFFFTVFGLLSFDLVQPGFPLLAFALLQLFAAAVYLSYVIIDLNAGGDTYFLRKLWTLVNAPVATPDTQPTAPRAPASASESRADHVELGTHR